MNNKINQILEEMAQAIFKEWFVKFRFPGWQKVKFVDSELGKIPEGWEVKKIKNIAKLQKGISYSSSEITDKPRGIPILNLANFLRGGGFNPSGTKYYLGKYKKSNLVQKGDIIIAITDLTSNREIIGHPARVPLYPYWSKILISLDVCVIKTAPILRDFLYYLMLRKDFSYRMASSASGTNVAHLNKSVIENYTFLLPSKDLLRQFHNFIAPLLIKKDKNDIENQKLSALRDLLLPKLMSGEIRV
ncbi:MAG: restriction endonuclease subunit S [Promethearchaeota archaeon]